MHDDTISKSCKRDKKNREKKEMQESRINYLKK